MQPCGIVKFDFYQMTFKYMVPIFIHFHPLYTLTTIIINRPFLKTTPLYLQWLSTERLQKSLCFVGNASFPPVMQIASQPFSQPIHISCNSNFEWGRRSLYMKLWETAEVKNPSSWVCKITTFPNRETYRDSFL